MTRFVLDTESDGKSNDPSLVIGYSQISKTVTLFQIFNRRRNPLFAVTVRIYDI